jgi:hypothetical protein
MGMADSQTATAIGVGQLLMLSTDEITEEVATCSQLFWSSC